MSSSNTKFWKNRYGNAQANLEITRKGVYLTSTGMVVLVDQEFSLYKDVITVHYDGNKATYLWISPGMNINPITPEVVGALIKLLRDDGPLK